MKFIHIFLFILILIGIALLATQKMWVPKLVNTILQSENQSTNENLVDSTDTPLADGRYCFSRVQEATATEPYHVEESIVLNIAGDSVTGTKSGTQNGPDMTNGYQGTLTGNKDGNLYEVTYAYTVEGSSNKELELYGYSDNALVKMRWPLVEENGVLVPDRTTGDPQLITYTENSCTASN